MFELFLRYVHQDRHLVDGNAPKPTWDQILLLSTLFDKYDTALLAKLVFSEQLPRFFRDPLVPDSVREVHYSLDQRTASHPPSRFAVASIHHLEDIAKKALRWAHVWGMIEEGSRTLINKDPEDENKMIVDFRPRGLGERRFELLCRLPMRVIQEYSRLFGKVLTTPGYSWIKAGDDFKVRSTFFPLVVFSQ